MDDKSVFIPKRERVFHSAPLVAEQPGFKVLIYAIGLSVLFFVLIQTFISPSKIKNKIDQNLKFIPSSVELKFKTSHISFSDGFFPRFALIVKDIIITESKICSEPVIVQIDELIVPLQFSDLIQKQISFKKIIIGTVELNLKNNFTHCLQTQNQNNFEFKNQQSKNETNSVQRQVWVKLKKINKKQEINIKQKQSIQDIELSVSKLNIHSQTQGEFDLSFSDLRIQHNQKNSNDLQVTAKVHFLKDPTFGGFLTHANLSLEYKNLPYAEMTTHLFGNWREGYFSLTHLYRPEEKSFLLSTDIKHIPINMVLGQLSRIGLKTKKIYGDEVWLSAQSEIQGDSDHFFNAKGMIKNLRFEGSLGEVQADEIQILKLEPFVVSPIEFNFSNLSVSKLFDLFKYKPSSVFGNLGLLKGQLNWKSNDDFKVEGILSGLEFIFGNKGRREVQIVNNIQSELIFEKGLWNLNLSQEEGESDHRSVKKFNVKSSRQLQKYEINFRADNLELSNKVVDLLTQGGYLLPVSLQLHLRADLGDIRWVQGQLKIPGLQLEDTTMKHLKINLDTNKIGDYSARVSLESLSSKKSEGVYPFLEKILTESIDDIDLNQSEAIVLEKLYAQLKTNDFKSTQWRLLSSQIKSSEVNLFSEGSWNDQGALEGQLLVKNKKTTAKWSLTGNQNKIITTKD